MTQPDPPPDAPLSRKPASEEAAPAEAVVEPPVPDASPIALSLSEPSATPPEPAGAPVMPPPPVALQGMGIPAVPSLLPPAALQAGLVSRYLRPADLRRFQNFQFAAKMIVEGFYSGRHRSPFHDMSAEFADYRPYVPGDELRSLDWRAYARTDRDYIKLFRKETDMRCHVLLDTSRSMAFRGVTDDAITTPFSLWGRRKRGAKGRSAPADEDAPLSKFEYGAYLTAALCYLIIRQGDKAGLALGASSLQTYLPPGGTITHLHSLLHQLDNRQPDGETHLARALQSLYALAKRRGLLVVISDFLEETEPLFDALAMYTYRGWQVLLLHVLTDAEVELPNESGPFRFLDAEGPGMADADPDALRPAYQAEVQGWLNTLEAQAKARRVHYARMTTSAPYDRALERYLTTRARS